jgi:glucose-6-phosphate 1-dehydrogenase
MTVTTDVEAAARSVPHELGVPDDHVLVLFGATGDLARRKLLPGLFHLAEAGLMPERYRIVCVSRASLTDGEFRDFARAAAAEFGRRHADGDSWEEFSSLLSYVDSDRGAGALAEAVSRADAEVGPEPRRLHYLSVPPVACADIVGLLGATGLSERARVILEKPFGTDLPSARTLNESVHAVFDESQIFRIDHFLGKEAMQNILALRFANGMFEPRWNRDQIDHVQIDVPETLSIGTRADFYERTGAFRDMVVTHLFQVLGVVAMEPPTSLAPAALVDEKMKVFQAMSALDPQRMIRGQYDGYLDEAGVAPGSGTETFVALEARVENWRWAGVPFYLRTGKRLAQSRRSITVAMREPPLQMFPGAANVRRRIGPNKVTFDVGEPGSISASFLAKMPGPAMALGPAKFKFAYEDSFNAANQLEAYERLIHDAMLGDSTLFTRADGIERLWEISTPVLEKPPPARSYAPGSWGPEGTEHLIAPRRWHLPEDPS